MTITRPLAFVLCGLTCATPWIYLQGPFGISGDLAAMVLGSKVALLGFLRYVAQNGAQKL